MSLKCLVIEDELPAQRVLKKYISDVPSLELAGMHKSAVEIIEKLRDEHIDLLFLDINLPKISGLNFLRSLSTPPQVIITTAYPDYAHEGFELNVVDFLLKPFSFERFLKAVSKVTSATQSDSATQEQQYVFVKVDNSLQKVDFETIIFIESDRDYVRVVMEDGRFRHLQTLKYWDSLLKNGHFAQVHKSFIVNIAKVQKIVGNRIEMPGEIIPIGRHYKEDFMEQIELLS